ncbi:MAG: hydrogenase iron-sulfur subunit [Thermoplasmata archaeon]|nr:MAG: hydrogenase iron-sulfur subunit [Thermoplasmata archaeon]MCD6469046.1 hydrogenase iron-sulfur subunit [Thermoplasmata archaeon]RLF28317.1 MAG: methyl-viologen-reducing hydrogenase subunit delta [Thermoplasmata archaeon]
MSDFEPNIVAFLCNWCAYAGADLAGTSRLIYPANVKPIRVMCSGRVDPVFVLEALKKGADGVLIAGCHPGDCHYQSGNYKANRRVILLKELLQQLNINPRRVRFEYVSASEGQKFANVVKEFVEEIKEIGPNPLRGEQ